MRDHARGQPARPASTGSSSRITRLPVSSVTPAIVGVEPVEHEHQLVTRQIGVGLDRQPDSQVLEAGSEPLDDVDRRLDLVGPGAVGAKAIVAIADVNPGVAAPQSAATAST